LVLYVKSIGNDTVLGTAAPTVAPSTVTVRSWTRFAPALSSSENEYLRSPGLESTDSPAMSASRFTCARPEVFT
jgi:hypothetical protein